MTNSKMRLQPAFHFIFFLAVLGLRNVAPAAQDDAGPLHVQTRVVDYSFAAVQLALAEYDAALAAQADETKVTQARVRYMRTRLTGAIAQLEDAARGEPLHYLAFDGSSARRAEQQADIARVQFQNAKKSKVPAEKVKLLELRLRVADLRLDAIQKRN